MRGELTLSSIGRSYIQQHLALNEFSGKVSRMLKEKITLQGLTFLCKNVELRNVNQLTADCIFAFASLLVFMCPTRILNSAHFPSFSRGFLTTSHSLSPCLLPSVMPCCQPSRSDIARSNTQVHLLNKQFLLCQAAIQSMPRLSDIWARQKQVTPIYSCQRA